VGLYRRANRRRSRVRAITVDADRLHSYAEQLSLFGSPARPEERQERITTALDHIRQRHGSGSVLPLSALPGKPATGQAST
jgi:hypothetical protein